MSTCRRLPKTGVRVLVDRLWPRSARKSDAAVDRWLKEVAPTTELRRWFGHAAGAGRGFDGRSTVRSSGSLRGPRGSRRRFVLDVSVAAISAFVSSSACVSPRSSIASSSYSTRSLPRLGQQQLQTLNFQGAELASPCASANISCTGRQAENQREIGGLLSRARTGSNSEQPRS